MGTRADFYVGKGKNAEWIGSIAYDGYPDGNPHKYAMREALTEEGYRACVSAMLETLDHATNPEDGWPWPWETSVLTDYAYAWDEGKVWVTDSSAPWWRLGEPHPYDASFHEAAEKGLVEFPDMSARRNVAHGARSGFTLMSVRLLGE